MSAEVFGKGGEGKYFVGSVVKLLRMEKNFVNTVVNRIHL